MRVVRALGPHSIVLIAQHRSEVGDVKKMAEAVVDRQQEIRAGAAGISRGHNRTGVSLLTLATGALVGALPFADLRIENALAGVALGTTAGILALLAAYLVLGRFMRSGRVSDLVLLSGLFMLACNNIFFGVLPAVLSESVNDALSNWAATTGSTLGAMGLMLSAWISGEVIERRRAAELTVGAVVLLLFVLGSIMVGFQGSIPPSVSAEDVAGHPLSIALQGAGAIFMAVAAVGFFRRADRDNDAFMRFVEAAAIMSAFARLNFLLHPIADPHWIYIGDILKLGAYMLLTWGAAVEIAEYWREMKRSAQLDERRRLARDMHDGLGQELAYIARQAQTLEHIFGPTREIQRIGASSLRALTETRRAIAALTDTSDQPLDVALAAEIQSVSERSNATVWLNLAQRIETTLANRDTLLRVAREATTNAVQHGGARRIAVELSKRGHRIGLRISDDGCGFDPDAPRREGFGLISMRERVEGQGGHFKLASSPGRGSEIEVRLPQ